MQSRGQEKMLPQKVFVINPVFILNVPTKGSLPLFLAFDQLLTLGLVKGELKVALEAGVKG